MESNRNFTYLMYKKIKNCHYTVNFSPFCKTFALSPYCSLNQSRFSVWTGIIMSGTILSIIHSNSLSDA